MNILRHVSGDVSGVGETELLLVRLSITNSVIDPWVYILFRREVMSVALNCARRVIRTIEKTQKSCSQSVTGSRTHREEVGSVQINPMAEMPWCHFLNSLDTTNKMSVWVTLLGVTLRIILESVTCNNDLKHGLFNDDDDDDDDDDIILHSFSSFQYMLL